MVRQTCPRNEVPEFAHTRERVSPDDTGLEALEEWGLCPNEVFRG